MKKELKDKRRKLKDGILTMESTNPDDSIFKNLLMGLDLYCSF